MVLKAALDLKSCDYLSDLSFYSSQVWEEPHDPEIP